MRERAAPQKLLFFLLAMAIFVAPFLGLLFDVKVSLGVMATTLAATAFILREASGGAGGAGRTLRVMAGVNVSLATGCAGAIIWLIVNGR